MLACFFALPQRQTTSKRLTKQQCCLTNTMAVLHRSNSAQVRRRHLAQPHRCQQCQTRMAKGRRHHLVQPHLAHHACQFGLCQSSKTCKACATPLRKCHLQLSRVDGDKCLTRALVARRRQKHGRRSQEPLCASTPQPLWRSNANHAPASSS